MTTRNSRNIKDEEKILITSILELANSVERITSIPEVVYDLDDGGMGSIKFTNNPAKVYGKDLLQVSYFDSETTPVIITLTVDKNDDLFELEFWKVNFEKLLRYPKANDIEIIAD
ncbi:MAG: DUF6984 family protein [Chitinophagales bacterium]